MSKRIIVVGLIIIVTIGLVMLGQRFDKLRLNPTKEISPTPSKNILINPASQNCVNQGGILITKLNGNNGQYNLCSFEDDMACEELAFFRGECPKGGVKTTGFDTDAQRYCAWIGGKTVAQKNAKCTMPNGKTCDNEKLFNGTCIEAADVVVPFTPPPPRWATKSAN